MNKIPFRIFKIENDPIELHADLYKSDVELAIDFEVAFNGSLNEGTIGCKTKYVFKQGNVVISSLSVYCYFAIEPEFLKKNSEEGKFVLEKDFQRYLATISVGTARGIQHARTQGTVLNTLVIPPINLMKMEIEDISIE